ncbi:hypothetical protein [Salinifilum ghardaiensis]
MSPATTCSSGEPTSQRLTALRREYEQLRADFAAWQAQLGQWQTYTPPLYSLGASGTQQIPVNLGSGGQRRGWFLRIGQRLHLHCEFRWGSPPFDAGPGQVVSELPPGLRTPPERNHYLHNHLWTTSGGNADWWGSTLLHPDAVRLQPMFSLARGDVRLGRYTIAGPNAGDRAWSVPAIPGGWPEGGLLELSGTISVLD